MSVETADSRLEAAPLTTLGRVNDVASTVVYYGFLALGLFTPIVMGLYGALFR